MNIYFKRRNICTFLLPLIIFPVPSVLQEALPKTRNSIVELLEPLMAKVYKFTAVVENAITCATDIPNIVCDSPKGTASNLEEKIEWAIEMLTASRQQEIYIRFFSNCHVSFSMRLHVRFLIQYYCRKLLSDVERSENEVKNLKERLRERLYKLHNTVRYRTAVPTAQVYVNITNSITYND